MRRAKRLKLLKAPERLKKKEKQKKYTFKAQSYECKELCRQETMIIFGEIISATRKEKSFSFCRSKMDYKELFILCLL